MGVKLMHLTPDDIAASIGNDPAVKAEDILYKYLKAKAIVRFEPLSEHFLDFGLSLTEQDMIRLMAIQEDILFTEGADDRGRFWRASIVPDQRAAPAVEGYLDHRVTDQYDDALGQDFDDEDDFTGRELAGINATPEPGQMNSLSAEGGIGDPDTGQGSFDVQTEPPVATAPATDQSEVPPAAVPRAMPDIIAQAMAPQMPDETALEPGIPEPGMQPGPEDQVDVAQPAAQSFGQGPGEEQPAPQTGAPMVPGNPAQAMQPQAQPGFGDDGADYTIDPFLNAFGDMANFEEDPNLPQTTNEPATGARTQQNRIYDSPRRYSQRMREARARRRDVLTG